eukprot:2570667-Rhodomonas_salina.2
MRTALGLEGAQGTLGDRRGVAPQTSPLSTDRTDDEHREGGAAPTLASGRTGANGSDSGSVGDSLPPTGCTCEAPDLGLTEE